MQLDHTSECLSASGLECNCNGIPVLDATNVVLETPKISEHPICLPTCSEEFAIHASDCPNNPKAVKLPKCLSCESDIQGISIKTQNGHVCLDCGLCCSCGDQVTITEIDFCLRHTVMIQHSRCRMKSSKDAIKIPVSEYELGILNNCRLLIIPDVEVSIETNVNSARLVHGQLWETMSLEQKFIHTQVLEAIYSSAYMALKKDPTEVKTKLRERDMKRTEEAHTQAKKDRQMQLPSERRKMGLQEKFLNGMLSSGISKEQAIAIWKSQGRVWME